MILRVRIYPRVIMIPGWRMNHRLRMNLRVRMIPKGFTDKGSNDPGSNDTGSNDKGSKNTTKGQIF